MLDPTANMQPDKRLRALQAGGTAIMSILALASALWGDKYPWINAVTVIAGYYIGKLLGVPISQVTRAAFQSMPPAKQAELSVKAVISLPPAARQEVIDQLIFLASDRPPPLPQASIPPLPPTNIPPTQ